MKNTVTVRTAAAMLDMGPDTVRDGIRSGSLPGSVIESDNRARYVIPRKALELYIATGLTPAMLAKNVMQAETIEQGIAYKENDHAGAFLLLHGRYSVLAHYLKVSLKNSRFLKIPKLHPQMGGF